MTETTDAIVMMIEEEVAKEDGITPVTSLLVDPEAIQDLTLEHLQDILEKIDLLKDQDLTDQTTEETDHMKKADTLLFTTISCPIRISSLKMERLQLFKSNHLSKME